MGVFTRDTILDRSNILYTNLQVGIKGKMSCHWDIHCFTCNEGVGLHVNHHNEEISNLVKLISPATKVLKTLQKEAIDCLFIDPDACGIYCDNGPYTREIPIAWFIEHEGHDVAPLNEYGQRIEEYNTEQASFEAAR